MSVTPAVALRLSGTRLNGVSQLDYSSNAFDVMISKGFPVVTPYGGIGSVHSKSKPNGVPTLASESVSQTRIFAGANFNLGIADLLVEGDRTGKVSTTSLRLGFRF